jgi:hypothetical protein
MIIGVIIVLRSSWDRLSSRFWRKSGRSQISRLKRARALAGFPGAL